MKYRELVWKRLAQEWKPANLSDTCVDITLNELAGKISLMLQGKLKGRTVLKLNE
jgi:acrylyl-CoA reductase (NADPH)